MAAPEEFPQLAANKGLNLIASPDALPREAVPDCGNVVFGAGARIASRGGTAAASTLWFAAPPSSTAQTEEFVAVDYHGYKGASVADKAQFIWAHSNLFISIDTPAGETVTAIPLPASHIRASTFAAPALRPVAVNYRDSQTTPGTVVDYVVFTFGDLPPLAISYTTTPTTATPTHADWTATNGYPTCCASYDGRMWYAGSDAFPNRLWVSAVGKVADVTPPGSPTSADAFTLDIDMVDGGRIIGMKHLFDILLVFTDKGVYRVVETPGSTVPYKTTFITTHAAVNPHAIVQADNAVVFLTRSAVYAAVTALTYGDVQFNELSAPIAPLIENMAEYQFAGAWMTYDQTTQDVHLFCDHNHAFAYASAVPKALTAAQAQSLLASYGLAYPSYVTECLSYNVRGGNWTRHYWPFEVHYATARPSPEGYVVDMYSATNGVGALQMYERRAFDGTQALDDGQALTGYFRTKREVLEKLSLRKHHVFAELDIVSGSVSLAANHDGRTSWLPAMQQTVVPPAIMRSAIRGSGKSVQLEVTGAAPFEVAGWSVSTRWGGQR